METAKLLEHIEKLDFIEFQKEWNLIKSQSTENERQLLLVEILDWHYHRANFNFFVKVFDEILKLKTSLDFNVDHWAPTLLSLAVHHTSKMIFQYFVRKGANINFIGDSFFNFSDEDIQVEMEVGIFKRYQTCLDFANFKYDDLFVCDYIYSPPFFNIEERKDSENFNEEFTITKGDYFNLVEQSIYLYDLIQLNKLQYYIMDLGGKTYEELKKL